jgi:hypothetical protein
MPALYLTAELTYKRKSLRKKFLLNSGAEDLEVVIPEKLANRLEIPFRYDGVLDFGGPVPCGTAAIGITIKSAGKRARLKCHILPDERLDKPLLGFLAMWKLGIILDIKDRKVLFR